MGLIAKLKEKLMRSFLTDALKDVAEGRHGAKLRALYWWLNENALVTLIAHGACQPCARADYWLRFTAQILTASGLAVGFHAADAPEKQ